MGGQQPGGIMIMNTGSYLQLFSAITLVCCGMVQYFSGMQVILWLPFFLTLLMVLLLVVQCHQRAPNLDRQGIIVLSLYAIFLVLSGISSLYQAGGFVTLVGFKNEIALSLVMICLLLGFCQTTQLYRVICGLYWVFYAQFPVVLYQLLVIVPQRVAVRGQEEKWDSVVGTFGGDPFGGGNSGVMGLFCLLIMLLKLSEYKHGIASLTSMVMHIILGFMLCIVGEVKFVLFLAPFLLAGLWLMPSYIKEVNRINGKMILFILPGTLILTGMAIVVLAYGYTSAFGYSQDDGIFSIFLDSLNYIFDPDYVISTGELGRFTTLIFWLKNNDLWGLSGTLFGYGLNATNSGSSLAPGFLNLVYHFILDATSLSMLLWEVGIIGTVIFIGLFFYILNITWPGPLLSIEQLDMQDVRLLSFSPALNVFSIGCLLSLPYSQIMMLVPMLQFLFYFSSGASLVIRQVARHYAGKYAGQL
ncbi:hypothetical protein EBL_c05250 [Shimwellia blattae DSM 4481 = NBRC 105725]|uniref:Capsular biosynthesis protein n=2 Tax=Shimwellia blattae TaxID=563 RepID=I2B547_SHIBC|nr:hypothetical protein EBL_c05250 [Shimwellia blattae DSM 4481 = NBRC 105725]